MKREQGSPATHREGPEDRTGRIRSLSGQGPRVQQVGQPREQVTEQGQPSPHLPDLTMGSLSWSPGHRVLGLRFSSRGYCVFYPP